MVSRYHRLRAAVHLANRAISSLNRLYYSSSNYRNPSHTITTAQFRLQSFVLRSASDFVRRRTPLQSVDPAEALCSLLHSTSGFDTYLDRGPPSTMVPLNVNTLSLPSAPASVPLLRMLPPDMAAQYADPEPFLRENPLPAPAPFIGGSFEEYEAVMIRLFDIGMVAVTDSPRATCGMFAVAKSDTSSRLIIDARPVNAILKPPAKVVLPSPSLLSRMVSSSPFFMAGADLSDYYHRLELPEAWQPYFSFPAVRAASLGLSGGVVHLCLRSLPMGWSHSVLLAQAAHVQLLHGSAGLDSKKWLADLPDLDVSSGAHSAYIDDLILFEPSAHAADAVLDHTTATYDDNNLPPKAPKVFRATPRAEVLGIEVDGAALRAGLSAEKMARLLAATRRLLKVGICSGQVLACVVGHWTWAVLVRRPGLAIFCAVYKFIAVVGRRIRPLWPSVRRELRMLCNLLPLFFSSLRDCWFDHAVAVDASSTGVGVCAVPVSPDVLRREAALAPVSGAPVRLDEAAEEKSLLESRPPAALPPELREQVWSVIVSSRWRWPAHINLLEVEAALLSLRWVLSHPSAVGRRIVIYSDSRVAVGALTKGRSSSFRLLRLLRRAAALVLSSGLQVHYRWLPSGENPADGPSRSA